MADWQKIKTEYVTTDTSYRKLAQKYGVNSTTICSRSRQEGWIEAREQYRNKTQTKIEKAIQAKEVSRAERVMDVSDKLLTKVEAYVEAVSPDTVEAKDLQSLSATIRNIRDIQYIRSDLDRREQEARIRQLEQRTDQDADGSVTITLEGDITSYAQ